MASRKSTKVKDLKPRTVKNASREAGSIKGGDGKSSAQTTKPTISEIVVTKRVDTSSSL
jgi:hypothetical protein